jgi:phenylacetate-coenzyme A ligase PaaK-like adenylate-forming protein
MTDAYGLLFQQLLHPGWESGIRQRPTLRHLKRLERTQWCSFDELCALQKAELEKLLAHAWQHVPLYRTRFEQAGLGLNDVRRLEDLPKLPLLTREEAALGFARKSIVPPLPAIDKATSGTSGSPFTFAYDRGSEYWRQATKLRGYTWAGYKLGDRSLHFWGSPPVTPPPLTKKVKVSLDHWIRREYYSDCTDRSEEALARVVRQIKKLRPSVILCFAQAGAALARHVNENKSRDWNDIPIIAAAERLFPTDRAALAEAFGPGIFETYGSREVMLIAAECEAHQGLHVSMENLVVEVIVRDGSGERPARPGELGEVAVTDLHNYGAPFIRYLTGDLAVERAQQRCACGRSLTLLEAVEGRTTDTLRDGAGRPVSGLFFSVLFTALAHKVRQFQVVQRRDGAIDLKLVPTNLYDDSLLELVRKHCERFIPGVELRTEIVTELNPDRGGKLRVVVVEN